MTSPITAKTCEAWFLLEAADMRGLPTPYCVDITDHGTKLGLRTPSDLRTWAVSLDTDYDVRQVGDRLHWNAEGVLHDIPVALFVVTDAEQVAS